LSKIRIRSRKNGGVSAVHIPHFDFASG
jgi:hypothetical protein